MGSDIFSTNKSPPVIPNSQAVIASMESITSCDPHYSSKSLGVQTRGSL
jgi:hypothetical protein